MLRKHYQSSFLIILLSLFLFRYGTLGLDPAPPEDEDEEMGTEAPEEPEKVVEEKPKEKKAISYPIVNRTSIETSCDKFKGKKCWASDRLIPICGSDKKVYLNPGVLMCAQRCNKDLEMEIFCDPTDVDADASDKLNHCQFCSEKIDSVNAPAAPAEEVPVEGEADPEAESFAAAGDGSSSPPTDGSAPVENASDGSAPPDTATGSPPPDTATGGGAANVEPPKEEPVPGSESPIDSMPAEAIDDSAASMPADSDAGVEAISPPASNDLGAGGGGGSR